MIKISGTARRTFTFPADLATTCDYYSDFNRILGCLPHIQLVDLHGPGQFRMVYHTTELGVYSVRMYCDLQAKFDKKKHTLHMIPLPGIPPVKPWTSVNALTAQGYYASESAFHAEGDHTRIEYALKLGATLPKPFGLNLIPDSILDRIASNITEGRIYEIAEGFIERTIHEFRWGDACVQSREKASRATRPQDRTVNRQQADAQRPLNYPSTPIE